MASRSLVLGLCLLLGALGNQLLVVVVPPQAVPATASVNAPLDFPDAITPAENPVVDATPLRLVIPSIHLDARVESRGLTRSHNLDTALDYHNVAWYDLGPKPGEPGNALINGHVNWWTGSAVFTYLARVRAGDLIQIIRRDGSSATFKVTAKKVVDAGARIASLFAPSQISTLTLITCTGPWDALRQTDTERLLVSAVLV